MSESIISPLRSRAYLEEEKRSGFEYPSKYQIKSIQEQMKFLWKLLAGARYPDEALTGRPLPDGAEGYFAIPRWQLLSLDYGRAIEKVCALLKDQRRGFFVNIHRTHMGNRYLRKCEKTVAAMGKIADEQSGQDILIVPAQFGLRHRGRSPRRACGMMNNSEFGLGLFEVGCMLLTHPEREIDWNNLHIDCPGDEYAVGREGLFNRTPIFRSEKNKLFCGSGNQDDADAYYGSASGFLSAQ